MHRVAGAGARLPAAHNGWTLAATAAAFAAAWWLRTPQLPALVACAVSVVVAALLVARRRAGAGRALLATVALAVVALAMAAGQRALDRASADPSVARAVRDSIAVRQLQDAVALWSGRLVFAAEAALDAPGDPAAAFNRLDLLPDGDPEAGVVLYRDGRPVAWRGTIRVPLGLATDSAGLLVTPFYTAVYAAATRGSDRAVATVLVKAEAPSARFARGLVQGIAGNAGVRDFVVGRPSGVAGTPVMTIRGQPVLAAAPVSFGPEALRLRIAEGVQRVVGAFLTAAIVLLVAAEWHRGATLLRRLTALAVVAGAAGTVPLSSFSNVSRWFDPAVYYAAIGGPFTATLGALTGTSASVLLVLLALRRSGRLPPTRGVAIGLAAVLVVLGPYLLRDLARGITVPTDGASLSLWIGWQLGLFLPGFALLVAAAGAGRAALGGRRGVPPWIAPTVALAAAAAAPVLWRAPSGWPDLYIVAWIAAVGLLATARRSAGGLVGGAAVVAAAGAVTLVWGAAARSRVELAIRDVAGLRAPDRDAAALLARTAADLLADPPGLSREALVKRFSRSPLVAAGYPVHIAAWPADGGAPLSLWPAAFPESADAVAALVDRARASGQPQSSLTDVAPWVELAAAVPHRDGTVTSLVVAPRTRLIADAPWAPLLGLARPGAGAPPYEVQVGDAGGALPGDPMLWSRRGSALHGDLVVEGADGPVRLHASVDLQAADATWQRGLLLILLDLCVASLLWAFEASAGGGLVRWTRMRLRRARRSYRARLSLALYGFAIVPVVAFALWAVRRLQADDRRARELVVQELLRNAMSSAPEATLEERARRADAPLLVYRDGELFAASEPLFSALAPAGRFLPPDVALDLATDAALTTTARIAVAGRPAVLGYRGATGLPMDAGTTVLAAPARADDPSQDRQREDLLVFVVVAAAAAGLAAWWLSGVAGRTLAAPIEALRRAAGAVAAGTPIPDPDAPPPAEFDAVFAAFTGMQGDLAESRAALEEAQRRTAAVLRQVASGVVAVGTDGTVTLANPRAEALLGVALPAGAPLVHLPLPALVQAVGAFMRGADVEATRDLDDGDRQYQVRLARLRRGGVVVTLDDVTELARAQRVLAWGEMARQVAHEIKNPLTPIRLGVQHLRRAHQDARPDFPLILDANVTRILAEIDRLDEIARSFSRYGMPAAPPRPPEPVDVAQVVRDVIALETMGVGELKWRADGCERPAWAFSREPELREVLLNLLENARAAGARGVAVRLARDERAVQVHVRDDGAGIPEDILPRVFEPHFSATSGGSGLGLALCKRLVEGWGGTITLSSAVGAGTTVTVTLAAARAPGELPG